MKSYIYGYDRNSYVDGPGIRMAIFFQGCYRHCLGCHNQGSWEPNAGTEMYTEEFKRLMGRDPLLEGITLSGGEPFLQPEAALELARHAHELGLNVWCYSGYTLEELAEGADDAVMALLNEIDVLVDGPYREAQRSLELKWRGSRNQRVIDMGKTRKKREVMLYECERVSEGSAADGDGEGVASAADESGAAHQRTHGAERRGRRGR